MAAFLGCEHYLESSLHIETIFIPFQNSVVKYRLFTKLSRNERKHV